MELSESELGTIKRALIIYRMNLHKGLRGKGFFIDIETLKIDIINIDTLINLIDQKIKK